MPLSISKYSSYRYIATFFVSIIALCICAAPGPKAEAPYFNWLSLPSDKLLEKGDYFLNHSRQPDSAMMCFTIVAQRYRPDMSRADMQKSLEGYYGRWQTQVFGFGNYITALSDLRAAEDIVEFAHLAPTKLYYYYGIFYLSVASSTAEKSYALRGAEYFQKAIQEASRTRDFRTLHRSFDNLVTASYIYDSLPLMNRELNLMRRLDVPQKWRKDVSLLTYNAIAAEMKGNLAGASAAYDSLIRVIPRNVENSRYLAAAYINKSRILKDLRPASTLSYLDSALRLTYLYDMPDVRRSALGATLNYYMATGDSAALANTQHHYTALKDSIISEKFLLTLQEINFSAERRRMQREMDAKSAESRLKGWVISLTSAILAVTLIFIFLLKRSNSKLRSRSEMLYRQLQSASQLPGPQWLSVPPAVSDEPQQPTGDEHDEADNGADAKYSGSPLSDDAKDEISEKISHIILQTESIFDPEFSLDTLASMLNSNRRYVSQAINQSFGCNFWTLVNRARVREAMRRLDSHEEFANYTIEAVAESVGFRSRSSFSAWFRKFTGLSAAEYRSLAKKERGNIKD